MDTHALIIGLVLILLMFVPLYYINKSNSVKKHKLQAIFDKFDSYNFDVNEHLNKKIVAIDTKNNGFLLTNLNQDKEETYFVNLNEIKNCKLELETEKNSDSIEKISFVFENKRNTGNEVIPLYDVNENLLGQVSVFENHQLAKKWVGIVNETIH